MHLMPMMMSMNATNLAYGSVGGMFGAMDASMAAANMVTGSESQSQIASLAEQDKAIALHGAMMQTNYLVSQALFAGAQNLKKKDQELQQRLWNNGAIFTG